MPFKIYADFECNVKGVKSNDKNNASYTKKHQYHIPYSFAYKIVSIDDKPVNQLFFTEEKMQSINILKQFLKIIAKK